MSKQSEAIYELATITHVLAETQRCIDSLEESMGINIQIHDCEEDQMLEVDCTDPAMRKIIRVFLVNKKTKLIADLQDFNVVLPE